MYIYSRFFLLLGFFLTSTSMLYLGAEITFNQYRLVPYFLALIQLFILGPILLISGYLLMNKYKYGVIAGTFSSVLLILLSLHIIFYHCFNFGVRIHLFQWLTILGGLFGLLYIKRVLRNKKYT